MINSSTTPTETKICVACGNEKPIQRFRFRSRKAGTRHNRCTDCHVAYQRECDAKKRTKDLRTFVHQVPRQRSPGALLALVANITKRFGGTEKLANAWVSEIKARMESKPGSKTNLDAFRSISLLMNAADAYRQKEREQAAALADGNVSAGDLERVIREAVEKVEETSS